MAFRTSNQAWLKDLDVLYVVLLYIVTVYSNSRTFKLPMQPIFKEISSYPDFLRIRIARRPS